MIHTIPQIIFIVMMLFLLMTGSYLHGKPKKGKHSIINEIISVIIWTTLLYYGGFFDK